MSEPPKSDADRESRQKVKKLILAAMEREKDLVIELRQREIRLGTPWELPEDNQRCLDIAHELCSVRCVSNHPFPIE